MDPDDRRYLIKRTLHYMRMGMCDFAIFEDRHFPDNYVQFTESKEYHEGRLMYFEVTSRTYNDQVLPPLSPEQVEALAQMGLGRTPNLNHAAYLLDADPEWVADLTERAFAVLGSTPQFDLDVKTSYWGKNPLWARQE